MTSPGTKKSVYLVGDQIDGLLTWSDGEFKNRELKTFAETVLSMRVAERAADEVRYQAMDFDEYFLLSSEDIEAGAFTQQFELGESLGPITLDSQSKVALANYIFVNEVLRHLDPHVDDKLKFDGWRCQFKPQTYKNGYDYPARPLGDTEWDVTPRYLSYLVTCLSNHADVNSDARKQWYRQVTIGHNYQSDELRFDPAAPIWAREWDGPFEIAVTRSLLR